MIRADDNSAISAKLAVFYQLRELLAGWTPAEWNENTHIILAVREMVGFDNSEILKDQEW